MDNVTEPWLLEPETIRRLKIMRTHIRKETGQNLHFSNREGLTEIILQSRQSPSATLKEWANEMYQRLQSAQ